MKKMHPAHALDTAPVRKPHFRFDSVTSRHWAGGDAFATHLFQALSLVFPRGERFFMDSVGAFRAAVDSPELRNQISHFLKQEASHKRAHQTFNAWIKSLGNDTDCIDDLVRARIETWRKLDPMTQLAVTCALEHFTAILAERFVEDFRFRFPLPHEIERLWLWHAVEETEHKAVAFDTYTRVGGTYRLRVAVMLRISFQFASYISHYLALLMKKDVTITEPFSLTKGWFRAWIWPGYMRPVLSACFAYYHPSFHPWQRRVPPSFDKLREMVDGFPSEEIVVTKGG